MALTKVRSPITDISEMGFGTTTVVIASAGGPIDIDVTGLDVVDMTSTTIDVDDLVTVTANLFDTEVITLATSGGAEGIVETQATLMSVQTTTAHPLELGANSITGLTIAIDGKVELDVVGTATDHLVDKNYVDVADALSSQLSDTTGNMVTNGSIVIPNSTGSDLIINWGQTASIVGTLNVTFDTAFTSAGFMGLATRQGDSSQEATALVGAVSTTSMNVHNSGSGSTPVNWIALGF